ncbi:MAG: TROVE domain-containing protein [Chthoniobacteraceae bacterium]
MANQTIFQSMRGAWLPPGNTVNEAGGTAYAFDARHALAQYAVTGCLNSTFYASAGTQLETVLKLAVQVDDCFLAQLAVYCRERGFMKDMPALLCAILASRNVALLEQIFDRVINDGKMLRNFVQIVRSGVTGRKSLGSAPKRLVRQWLERRDETQVFRASVGQSPSLADVVKMVHPRPAVPAREALYGWLIGRPHQAQHLPRLVQDFEAFKAGQTSTVPDVPFQMLTALELDEKAWAAIAATASWQTTRMNLNTFARHGVFKNPALTDQIANRLRNPEAVKQARCFPYQLLTAFQSAGKEVPDRVRDALQDAMEIATQNVPEVRGRVVVCPDISGSMRSPVTGYRAGSTTATQCIDVAALVAACLLRKNSGAEVLPFSDDVVKCRLNSRDSVMTNAQKLSSLPSGGTNCSAPLRDLNARQEEAGLVLIVSDNMSWMDSRGGGRSPETMRQWETFRTRNPQARLVCLDLQPNGSTQAQERPDILNIGGFTDSGFEIIATFAGGELNSRRWVELIEQTTW